jgi:hypothetical protein
MIQKHTTDDKDHLTAKGWADMIVIQGENKQEFIKFALKTLKELGYQTEIEKGLCEEYIFCGGNYVVLLRTSGMS